MSRKERLALKAEASAGAKGKKPVAGLPSRVLDPKADPSKEKKKPSEVGYQGTARPAKKPVEVGYKGTARPASAPATSSRNGTPAVKAKPNPAKGRYDGYADWDELSDMEDEEEDYASDASSDMEGGIWDVEEEEQIALKVAKKEDAEALAEERRSWRLWLPRLRRGIEVLRRYGLRLHGMGAFHLHSRGCIAMERFLLLPWRIYDCCIPRTTIMASQQVSHWKRLQYK